MIIDQSNTVSDRGAVLISKFWQGRAAARTERGHRRSLSEMPVSDELARLRRSAGLSHALCEALSMNVREIVAEEQPFL